MLVKAIKAGKRLYYRWIVVTGLNFLFPNEQIMINLVVLMMVYPIVRLTYFLAAFIASSVYYSVMSQLHV
ncbi:hypothetical protein EON65_27630 [archaeon]|nr:MAG: hypothetical protein EON65_27630 [archaeon]